MCDTNCGVGANPMSSDDAVYYDVTWCGFAGAEPPEEYKKIWSVVCDARDAALDTVRSRFGKGDLHGWEIDEACRAVVERIAATYALRDDFQVGLITLRPDGAWSASSLRGGFRVSVTDGGRNESVRAESIIG